MKNNKIGRTAAILTIIVVVGKAFGFLREVLLAYFFGTSKVVDAYVVSVTIPFILFGFLSALGVAFIPKFYKISENNRNAFLTSTIITSVFISVICISVTLISPEKIVTVVAGGFNEETIKLTASYLRITIFLILFNTPVQLLIAYLNCNEKYISSNISNLLLSSVQCIFVIFAAKVNVYLLPVGILVSYVIQFGLLYFHSLKVGYRIELKSTVKNEVIRLIISALPICLSTILIDINGFVDKYFSSFLESGSISALNYAYNVFSLFYFIGTSAMTTISFPRISEYFQLGLHKEISCLINKLINTMLVLLIPTTIICVLNSRNLIYIVLQRGNFDISSLELTSVPFMYYSIGLVFISVREVFIRVLYALEKSNINLIFGVVNIGLNIAFSAIFVRLMGIGGLAFATSISSIVSFPLYMLYIMRRFTLSIKRIMINCLKIFISCIPLIVVLVSVNIMFPLQNFVIEIIKLIISYGISISICFLLMRKFNVDGLNDLKYMIQPVLAKK